MTTPRFHALTIADIRGETAEASLVGFAVAAALAPACRYRPTSCRRWA